MRFYADIDKYLTNRIALPFTSLEKFDVLVEQFIFRDENPMK